MEPLPDNYTMKSKNHLLCKYGTALTHLAMTSFRTALTHLAMTSFPADDDKQAHDVRELG